MKLKCYLVVQGKKTSRFARSREPGSLRLTKNNPRTNADEIAVKLDIEIPDGLFDKPTLEARIQVPELPYGHGEVSAEVADNLAAIIQERTGLTVRVSAIDDEEADQCNEQ